MIDSGDLEQQLAGDNRLQVLPDGTRTVSRTGRAELRALLELFESTLKAHGFVPEELFRAGLEAEAIVEAFGKVGLTPPDELVAFYEWRDGYTSLGWSQLPIAEMAFGSLDSVLARYADRGALVGTLLELDAPLVILSAEGRGQAVLCDEAASKPPRVMSFWEENTVTHRSDPVGWSMCTWVASWLSAIAVGRWVAADSPAGRFWRFDPSRYRTWIDGGALG